MIRHRAALSWTTLLAVAAAAYAAEAARVRTNYLLSDAEMKSIVGADGVPGTGCDYYIANLNCSAVTSDGEPSSCGATGATGGNCTSNTDGCTNVCTHTGDATFVCGTNEDQGNVQSCGNPTTNSTTCGVATSGGSCTPLSSGMSGAGCYCYDSDTPPENAPQCGNIVAGYMTKVACATAL